MVCLLTGSAGFIGFHTSLALLKAGQAVIGIDNLNDYYDVELKRARLQQLQAYDAFHFYEQDIIEGPAVDAIFKRHHPQHVIHLAAQAGVRYSIDHPQVYIDSNINGFCQILEACRHHQIEHLVYASTSSVYGLNRNQPFSEHHRADHPMSLYSATKKANELMAHSYAHLYRLPCTGLRFFTVYGPWGRPDMALFKFTKAMLAGQAIDVYNHGDMIRDFTYIDDIVEGVLRILERPASPDPSWQAEQPDPASSSAPYRLYNIGNSQPIPLLRYIEALESALGLQAEKNFLPMQAGDVYATYANTDELASQFAYQPKTSVEAGVARFIEWYRGYYG